MSHETITPLGRDTNSLPPTLESLYRSGDFTITETTTGITCIDLTVRRSGCTLYGSGWSLNEAIDDVWDQLSAHTEALNHLEDLGVESRDVGRLVGLADEYDSEYDPAFQAPPLDPAFLTPPALAAAGAPIEPEPPLELDLTGPSYLLALLIPVKEARA